MATRSASWWLSARLIRSREVISAASAQEALLKFQKHRCDVVLADLTSEESKPYVDAFREVAMEVGIPDAAFAKLMHGAVGKLVENGLSISTDPEQAMQINGEAEMEALTRDLGPQGANDALRQIDTFAQKLANNGILQNEKDVQEFAQMVGTAQGLQIMQRIIVAEFGEKAIPKAEGVETWRCSV